MSLLAILSLLPTRPESKEAVVGASDEEIGLPRMAAACVDEARVRKDAAQAWAALDAPQPLT